MPLRSVCFLFFSKMEIEDEIIKLKSKNQKPGNVDCLLKQKWNNGNYSAIRKDSSKYNCWLYFLARALVYNHLVCWWYISTERVNQISLSPKIKSHQRHLRSKVSKTLISICRCHQWYLYNDNIIWATVKEISYY